MFPATCRVVHGICGIGREIAPRVLAQGTHDADRVSVMVWAFLDVVGLSSEVGMFLIFYVAGLGALFVVMGCEPPGVRRTMLPDPLPELSAHELAYLHGGEHRVADTELAVLHRQRKLVVTRDLLLAAVGRTDGAWWGPDATLSNVLLAACRKRPQRPGDLISVAKEGREMATLPVRLRQLEPISSARIRTAALGAAGAAGCLAADWGACVGQHCPLADQPGAAGGLPGGGFWVGDGDGAWRHDHLDPVP